MVTPYSRKSTCSAEAFVLIAATASLASHNVHLYLIRDAAAAKPSLINISIQKGKDKVVDGINAADITANLAICRCWRSAKFPYCDGAHGKHNKETGDNVGPFIIKVEKK
jgi:CDGSH-type Zn-finger protein